MSLVLVLNAGSSSLKFCLYHAPAWEIAARGLIEGIGNAARLRSKDGQGREIAQRDFAAGEIADIPAALGVFAAWLDAEFAGQAPVAVGHRVVHGGEFYADAVAVDETVLRNLHSLNPLAPLHQIHSLRGIEAVAQRFPGVAQVACFDTAFHRGQAQVSQMFGLPWELYQAGVRRYGFHGLSYEYIASRLPQIAPELAQGRVIVAHLGSGASLCAIQNSRSVESTFSFTPLDGLCMGSRPGAVDPGAILYLFQGLGLSASEVEDLLYRKSGLLGISGISNDMRELVGHADARAQLAVDYFIYRCRREIGALAALMGGLDGLVFTAGIGENSAEIRRRVCQAAAWLGLELDEAANASGGPRISSAASRVSAWAIPTDEERMIARHAARLLGL